MLACLIREHEMVSASISSVMNFYILCHEILEKKHFHLASLERNFFSDEEKANKKFQSFHSSSSFINNPSLPHFIEF